MALPGERRCRPVICGLEAGVRTRLPVPGDLLSLRTFGLDVDGGQIRRGRYRSHRGQRFHGRIGTDRGLRDSGGRNDGRLAGVDHDAFGPSLIGPDSQDRPVNRIAMRDDVPRCRRCRRVVPVRKKEQRQQDTADHEKITSDWHEALLSLSVRPGARATTPPSIQCSAR
jgi:hypothetical protein